MKTILEICKEVADLASVKRPTDLFNASSQQDSIFLSVAKSTLDSLMRYGDWPELVKEGCLMTVPRQNQYLIADFAPDFYSLLNDTIYIRDTQERIVGAITPAQWAKEKCFSSPSNDVKFKIQNGRVIFSKSPTCRLKIMLQYRSNNVVWDFNTFEEKSILSANTDVPIFDEYLVKLGILWRWLKRSGLDYSEEFNEYERELKKRYGVGLATQNINLAQPIPTLDEGVTINAVKTNNT